MRTVLIAIVAISSISFADTNSDLFTACPKQRAELNKFIGGGSSKCQDMLSKAAKCCNLFPGCEVTGISETPANGNVQGGNLLIAALQARMAGIDQNIHKCDESSLSADLPCLSEKYGATSGDKQLKIKFNSVAGDFRECMAKQKPLIASQIMKAGGSVNASGGTANYGNEVTEQQILQQLQSK